MTKTLCFIDTETTSLRPDRRAWEIGLIRREPGRPDEEFCWFIRVEDLDLGNADLASLRVGRFHQRHPGHSGSGRALEEGVVLDRVERLTRGATIIGAVPSFDTDVLDRRMRAHGICPAWHYHLADIETLAVGHLRGQHTRSGDVPRGWPFTPPWSSDQLSRAIGVEPPNGNERHTALGDARWAARVWDAIFDGDR